MDKLERIACLYLTFLNTGGIGFSRIREMLPLAYPGEHESARRKFERDKEELKTLGLELRHYPPGDSLPDGRVANDHVYLPAEELTRMPELDLSGREYRSLAALLMRELEESSHAGRPEEYAILESATAKLLYRSPGFLEQNAHSARRVGPLRSLGSGDSLLEERLSEVHRALSKRRWLEFEYTDRAGKTERRRIAGRGLVSHRGRWCLVGLDQRANALRSFYLDRMQDVLVSQDGYSPDPGFDIREYSLHPLAVRIHAPVEVELRLGVREEENFDDLVAGLPDSLRAKQRPPADTLRRLRTTNLNGLFSWMLRHPGVVSAIGPESVRLRFQEYLERTRALYQ